MHDRRSRPMNMAEIRKMEKVCRLAAEMLQYAATLVKPGVSTLEINDAIHDRTLSIGCESAPLNYHGFPKSVCTSVNEVVCHGVPRADEILMPGDIINVDVTLKKDGFFGDTSATFFVGEVTDKAKAVTEAAKQGMLGGIEQVKAGNWTHDIGRATDKIVSSMGFHTVKTIGGHGIGDSFHKEPFIPAFDNKGESSKLQANTCITVEPMVNETSDKFREHRIPNSDICWYTTLDNSFSAQFEHTILVTKKGHEVLTAW